MSVFESQEYVQAIYNASNRKERRAMLYNKNRAFTKKGYAFGVRLTSKLYGLAEHYNKQENKNDR